VGSCAKTRPHNKIPAKRYAQELRLLGWRALGPVIASELSWG
jgi:hypothetical protein